MHVVQHTLISCGPDFAEMILQEVAHGLSTIAHNTHGLCILKKCISHHRPAPDRPGAYENLLLEEMSYRALELIQGPYSNYAVQHALEEWGGEVCLPIINALTGRLVELSIQKFSSNVVEHVLQLAPPEAQERLLEELASPDRTSVLVSTVYGHYVASRVLRLAAPAQKASLESAIAARLGGLRNRRLRTRMENALRGEPDDSDDGGREPMLIGAGDNLGDGVAERREAHAFQHYSSDERWHSHQSAPTSVSQPSQEQQGRRKGQRGRRGAGAAAVYTSFGAVPNVCQQSKP